MVRQAVRSLQARSSSGVSETVSLPISPSHSPLPMVHQGWASSKSEVRSKPSFFCRRMFAAQIGIMFGSFWNSASPLPVKLEGGATIVLTDVLIHR